MKLVVSLAARQDLKDAVDWYQSQKTGLDDDLRVAIERQMDLIVQMPELFPLVNGIHRRCVIRRFPYVLYYRLDVDKIRIIALMHARRDPGDIARRLGRST